MTDIADAARRELLDRLAQFKAAPRVVLDVGGGVTAADAAALRRNLPGARIIATRDAPRGEDDGEIATPDRRGPFARAVAGLAALRRLLPGAAPAIERVTATPDRLPLADGSVDLALGHWLAPGAASLDGVLAELRRVLAPGGLFLWTTPGLGAAAEPLDMHDLGAALARAGFTEPVLDVDRHHGPDGIAELIHAAAFAVGAPRPGAPGETVIPLDRLARRRPSTPLAGDHDP